MEAAHRCLRNRPRVDRPHGHRRDAGRRLQGRAGRRHSENLGRAYAAAAGPAALPRDGSADRAVRAPLPAAGRRRSRVDSGHLRARLPRDPTRQATAALVGRAIRASDLMERLPVLPLGQLVVYPHVVLPLAITDPIAVELLDEVVQGNKRLLLAVVKARGGVEPPEGPMMQSRPEALYEVGTLGTIVRMLKLGDGTMRVMLQGIERAQLVEIVEAERWLTASYQTFTEKPGDEAKIEALNRSVHAQCAL